MCVPFDNPTVTIQPNQILGIKILHYTKLGVAQSDYNMTS